MEDLQKQLSDMTKKQRDTELWRVQAYDLYGKELMRANALQEALTASEKARAEAEANAKSFRVLLVEAHKDIERLISMELGKEEALEGMKLRGESLPEAGGK